MFWLLQQGGWVGGGGHGEKGTAQLEFEKKWRQLVLSYGLCQSPYMLFLYSVDEMLMNVQPTTRVRTPEAAWMIQAATAACVL